MAEPSAIKKWAREANISEEDLTQVIKMPECKKLILDNLLELAKANKFSGLEKIKKIHLTLDAFSIENEILTPTMKIKRNVAKKVYEKEIDQMYAELQ